MGIEEYRAGNANDFLNLIEHDLPENEATKRDWRNARNLLKQQLLLEGSEYGLDIRWPLPIFFRNYPCNLFQRLLTFDDMWTNNVSGLLTQTSSLTQVERRENLAPDFDEQIRETMKVMNIERN